MRQKTKYLWMTPLFIMIGAVAVALFEAKGNSTDTIKNIVIGASMILFSAIPVVSIIFQDLKQNKQIDYLPLKY